MARAAAAALTTLLRRSRPSAASFSTRSEASPIGSSCTFLADLHTRYGFPPSVLPQLLRSNRFLLDSDPRAVQRSLKGLLSFGISPQSLVSVVRSSPRLLDAGFLTRWETAFSQLGFPRAPPSTLERILQRSSEIDPEDVLRNWEALSEAGIGDTMILKFLEEFPSAQINLPEISRRINLIREIGLSKEDIDRIICCFPGFLLLNVGSRLMPLLEELAELNCSKKEIRRNLLDNPTVLLSMDPGELHRYINLLTNAKCRIPIKDKIVSKGAIHAGIRAKIFVDFLFSRGLIRREALRVLWKEPRVILYDLDDIKNKVDFLMHTMKLPIDWLVEVPEFLGVNLKKQVIPRYNVLEHLKSRQALAFQIDLRVLVKSSRKKFYNMFVKPYPQCEEIFKPLKAEHEGKPEHPKGLWMLLRPSVHPQMREDVCNMKYFMDSLHNPLVQF